MNLVEESFKEKERQKKKRTTTIILILIAVVLIAIIAIIVYISKVKSSSLKIYLDGKSNAKLENLLEIEEDGTVYAKIKEIASYLGYESYNGEYSEKSEEINKCYVENKEEICNFELGSNKLYKLDLTSAKDNYEYCYIKEPIKSIGGEIYGSSEAIKKGFNVSFEYDKDKNTITIYTLPYLKDTLYTPKILDKGYKRISDVLSNKKAMLDDMLVVEGDDYMSVINTSGETVLESKYTNITYLPSIKEFLIETTIDSEKKVGIISSNKKTVIKPIYDSIDLMDVDSELYLVGKENKYGVIDFKGQIKINIENDKIGIDINEFSKNDLKNKYILADNCIPIKKGNYWGLFKKNGQQLVEFKYDNFGYIASGNKDALNLLVIPKYNTIVACKNKKYTLLKSNGEELFAPIADDIYMKIEGNEKHYYINANNIKDRDAIKFLESIGVTAKNSSDNSSSEKDSKNNTTQKQTTNSNQTVDNSVNTNQEDDIE